MRGGERTARLNASLAARVRAGDPDGGLQLFRRMHRDGLPLDGYSFTPAFAACPVLPPPSAVAGCWRHGSSTPWRPRWGPSSSTITALPAPPSSTRPARDAVAWNALLSCFIRHGRPADAVAAFRRMTLEEGVDPTGFTLATLVKACGALKIRRRGEQVHASLVVAGAWDSAVLGTALVDFYSDCGLIDQAIRLFARLQCSKDDAAHNALIAGCVKNGRHAEAFAVLREMEEPSAAALTTALSACADSCNLRYGRQIHCTAVRGGLTGSTMLCNALSDMYSRCGTMEDARSVFEVMPARDVVSWTGLIRAYGSHGPATEAVRLFKEMEEEGHPSPNAATLLSVLSACGHAGLVDEGRECFLSMKARHGEAWELFTGMCAGAAVPGIGVCVAMLNACRACADVAKGLRVAERLLGLAPAGGAGIYKVEELRRLMKGRGLRKQRGHSWIDRCRGNMVPPKLAVDSPLGESKKDSNSVWHERGSISSS
ncbi:unnamed protein product [Spirodela intermedia]|uniref:Uncharacterized protein n=1 Tax=Spirodela intermedia TaxID=51605 RepID=A0A7I8J8R3_SPIIN|nr:unnamed protein product [Spirodela intermedia]CAA6666450.1 unnamed protein product [Spirodela intermedia]